MYPDRSAVELDQAAHDGQSDAESALGAIERLVGLRKEIEDGRRQIVGNADPVVAHTKDHFGAVPLDRELDAAPFIGVLRGVVQQVPQDLRETRGVGMHPERFV